MEFTGDTAKPIDIEDSRIVRAAMEKQEHSFLHTDSGRLTVRNGGR